MMEKLLIKSPMEAVYSAVEVKKGLSSMKGISLMGNITVRAN
jgi:hypothetical protein